MAYFEYSETYRETNLRTGLQREFNRRFRIDGEASEVKMLAHEAFRQMPQYRYPLVERREEMFRKLIEGKGDLE